MSTHSDYNNKVWLTHWGERESSTISRICKDSARDQQAVLDISKNLKDVHLLRWGRRALSVSGFFDLLQLIQFSIDVIADQKLQLAVLNAFDNNRKTY